MTWATCKIEVLDELETHSFFESFREAGLDHGHQNHDSRRKSLKLDAFVKFEGKYSSWGVSNKTVYGRCPSLKAIQSEPNRTLLMELNKDDMITKFTGVREVYLDAAEKFPVHEFRNGVLGVY